MNHNKLAAFWSKRERDFMFRFPRSWDGHLLCRVFTAPRHRYDYTAKHVVFDCSLVEELEARGYDTKTLRFSVDRRLSTVPNGTPPFDAVPASTEDK